ncbi:hypothetical protein MMC27_001689 [Xylographa pallens]|nr:hypothetical protein [Xylographa pallens]
MGFVLGAPPVPEEADRDYGRRPHHSEKVGLQPLDGFPSWLVQELVAQYGKDTHAEYRAQPESEVYEPCDIGTETVCLYKHSREGGEQEVDEAKHERTVVGEEEDNGREEEHLGWLYEGAS